MNRLKPHKICHVDKIKKYADWYVLLKWQIICDKKCVTQDFGGNTYSKNIRVTIQINNFIIRI